jgi:tRNA(Ile)-lysidine synthase
MRKGRHALAAVMKFLAGRDLRAGLVLAVSGGPDSVALLRAVLAAPAGRRIPVVVAHLNHGLRGADSDADAAFVAELCDRLRTESPLLQFRGERLDVAAHARAHHANLEAEARRLRYAWLAEAAVAHGCRHVATGHTADDQAETVLHHLLRGAGLAGLRGIARRRRLAEGVELVRPLLSVARSEILAFLNQLGQESRLDASNADRRFTRNRIRHELLPLLVRDYNPSVAPVLARLAEQSAAAHRVVARTATRLLRAAELPRAGSLIVLDPKGLADAVPYLVGEVLRRIWKREGWPSDGMNAPAWERLIGVVQGQTTAVDLPGGVRAVRRERVVQIGPR